MVVLSFFRSKQWDFLNFVYFWYNLLIPLLNKMESIPTIYVMSRSTTNQPTTTTINYVPLAESSGTYVLFVQKDYYCASRTAGDI